MQHSSLAFIGAGNMAQAIIEGLINNDYPPKHIWATAPCEQTVSTLAQRWAIHTSTSNLNAAQQAKVLVLSVKPQVLQAVATELAPLVQARKPLIISIAAGITTAALSQWLGGGELAIIRTMPNTPALVNCGATGLYANHYAANWHKELAEAIFRSVGLTAWLNDEAQIDAVAALSGSGPAYLLLVLEALVKAGTDLGLSAELSRSLSLQTMLGTARLALTKPAEFSELRRQVTSPGGTTERALAVLFEGQLPGLFTQALQAANLRAKELAMLLSQTA